MSVNGRVLGPTSRAWQELVERIQQSWALGDFDHAGELFLTLQEDSTGWLMAIARQRGPAGLAEELVAQAHFELFEKIERGEAVQNVKGLLGTIVRRRSIDALRRRNGVTATSVDEAFWERHAATTTPYDYPEDQFDQIEDREATSRVANSILVALPMQERAVLIARDIDELGVAETAVRLGLTEDQVKKRRRRAIESAQRVIDEQGLRHEFS